MHLMQTGFSWMETKEEEQKMPTTYAHDLFGKRVYRRLPEKLQHLIRSNGNLYRIGQHGPDILFYYFISKNPVTQYGVRMHGRKARDFLKEEWNVSEGKKIRH